MKSRRIAVVGVVTSLVVGVGSTWMLPTATAATPQESKSKAQLGATSSRKNLGNPSAEADALTKAKSTKSKVEVAADRTTTDTVWANPDGTLSRNSAQAPIRAKNAKGDLVPVDLDLASNGSRLAPKAANTDVSFSSTGNGPLATLATAGSTSVGLNYSGALGAPTVSNGTASYALTGHAGQDLAVTSTSTGFAAHVILSAAPTTAPTYTFPLQLHGLVPSLKDDTLTLSKTDGTPVAQSQPLRMWDARHDAAGDPSHVVDVDAKLVQNANGTSLQLTPSLSYLTAADTQYPVTIDPDISKVTQKGDTDYYSTQGSANQAAGSYALVVGSHDGSTIYRSLLTWGFKGYLGQDVTKATLSLWEYYAATCTAKQTDAYPMTADAVGNITWANRPTISTDARFKSSQSFNHGSSGCPRATEPMDVTPMVNAWANSMVGSTLTRQGIELRAANETDSTGDKRFCSANYVTTMTYCNAASQTPVLSVTYVPQLGSPQSASFTSHTLDDRSTLKINNDNGNAIVEAKDADIKGIGSDLQINRYYNSQAGSAAPTTLGPKWSMSIGPDVWLEKRSDYRYDYHAAGGAVYGAYTRSSATSSTDPSNSYNKFLTPLGGADAELKDNTDGTFTLADHQSQSKMVFTKIGSAGNLYLTKTKDRSDNTVTYNYTAGTNNLSSITDTEGRTITIAYTSGLVTSITDTNGPSTRTWVYRYAYGVLTGYTNPAGDTTTYGWDLSGSPKVTTITDSTSASGLQPKTTLTYTSEQATSVRYATASGAVGYDFVYNSTAATSCSGSTRSTDVFSTDTSKGKTTYCFKDQDDTGAPKTQKVIDADGDSRSTEYSPDNQPTKSTNSKGQSTVSAYGGAGVQDQLQSTTDPTDAGATSGSSSKYKYSTPTDRQGDKWLPSSKVDSNNNCTAYKYDTTGRLTDSYAGQAPGANSDCSGQTGGHHWQQSYNSDGTVAWSADPDAGSSLPDVDKTLYTYWQSTDSGYSVGDKGQVKTTTKPGGSCTGTRNLCTSYSYDGLSRISSMTDGRGKTTRYAYDKLDRVYQVLTDSASTCSLSAGTCVTYTYDPEGNLKRRDDVRGTTYYTYDRLNRQLSQATPDSSTVSYTYNDDGKMLTLKQSVTGGPINTTAYTYDSADRPITVTDASGTINVTHDGDGHLTNTKFPTTPAVTIQRTYTNAGRPNQINVLTSGTPDTLPETNYSYQKSGKDTGQVQKTIVSGSTTAINSTVDYTYNNDGRLTQADRHDGNVRSFTYDGAGNLTDEQVGSAHTYYGYDHASQLCWQGPASGSALATGCPATPPSGDTKIGQDAAGNSTGTAATPLAYNADNQVSSINGQEQGYNDLGNNLRVTAGADQLVNSNIGVTALKTQFGTTYYTRSPSGKILAAHGLGGTRYYVTDYQNSVTLIVDGSANIAAAYRYSPYGDPNVLASDSQGTANSNPWRYISGYYDIEGDGYTKLGARYYDNHSHFTQTDPKPGQLSSPGTLNSYGYAAMDPVNHSDANGRNWVGTSLKFLSGYDLAVETGQAYSDFSVHNYAGAASIATGAFLGYGAGAVCAAGVTAETAGLGDIACAGVATTTDVASTAWSESVYDNFLPEY